MSASQRLSRNRQAEFFDKHAEGFSTEAPSECPPGPSASWCDPGQHEEIVGADFGRGQLWGHMLYRKEDFGPIPSRNAFDYFVEKTPPNSLIILESAHGARPRTIKSLAQPFTAEEIVTGVRRVAESGRRLMLFPESQTRRIASLVEELTEGFVSGEKASDLNDAKVLAYYVGRINKISLISPPRDITHFATCGRRIYGRLARNVSNSVLNPARTLGYEISELFPTINDLAHALHTAHKYTVPLLGDGIAVAAGIVSFVVFENPNVADRVDDRPPSLLVYRGRAPGWRFFKEDVLMLSPCHRHGGVFRSNVYYHRFHSILKGRMVSLGYDVDRHKRLKFWEFDATQDIVRQEVMRSVREQLKTLYLAAVAMCESAGLPRFELLESAS